MRTDLSVTISLYLAVHRIVSVGGDGTFTQVINGLIQRIAQDLEVDLNDHKVNLPQLPLRIGIIPAGKLHS